MSATKLSGFAAANNFLSEIWSGLAPEDYIFVGRKDWVGGNNKFLEIPARVANLDKLLAVMADRGPDDWYFCPNGFKAKSRQRQHATGKGWWLYADLDEVDPYGLPIKPTVAWETSTGRYQAGWLMSEGLGPRAFERLNKALTYHVGADKGGWSWTKYLRVPGTVSNKHEEPFAVRILWTSHDTHDKADLRRTVKDALKADDPASGRITLPSDTGREIARKYWSLMSGRGKKLVNAKGVRSGDDRSAKMWDLHVACAEAGMSTGEAVRVVQECVYNKYRGQRREVRALWAEAEKAHATVARRPRGPIVEADGEVYTPVDSEEEIDHAVPLFRPIKMGKYLAQASRDPSWLVDQVWGDGAYGWWAGYEKTFKSTLMIDFALSVASGMPFMGYYDVPRAGPVLLIQEENSEGFMRDKLHRIANSKALAGQVEYNEDNPDEPWYHMPRDPKLWMVNQRRFDLADSDHMSWLESWIAENRPRAVLMDPLYRITAGLNENEGETMAPILNHIAAISAETGCAIIIAHHFKKPQDGQSKRPTHQLSGAGVMGRWWASAVFSDIVPGESSTVSLEFQHREHPDSAPVKAKLIMDEGDPNDFDVEVSECSPEDDIDLKRAPPTKRFPRSRYPQGWEFVDPQVPSRFDDAPCEAFDMAPGEVVSMIALTKRTGLKDGNIRSRTDRSASYVMGRMQTPQGLRRFVVRHPLD